MEEDEMEEIERLKRLLGICKPRGEAADCTEDWYEKEMAARGERKAETKKLEKRRLRKLGKGRIGRLEDQYQMIRTRAVEYYSSRFVRRAAKEFEGVETMLCPLEKSRSWKFLVDIAMTTYMDGPWPDPDTKNYDEIKGIACRWSESVAAGVIWALVSAAYECGLRDANLADEDEKEIDRGVKPTPGGLTS